MSDEIHLLHQWVDDHRDDIIEALRGVLRIPSKEEAPDGPDAPYGRPVRDALDYTLNLCRDLGFQVKDVDGHAGHAEFGAGDEMVAAIGHLDVVPEGDRWSYPPFGAEIHDGYIYSRGAADDKGPTFAALFAAKALMDSALPLKRRVRVIFGCDEESGFGCVKHYWGVAKEERPAFGFTPDADFPMVYAEKGIANITLSRQVSREVEGAGLQIQSMTGGLRPNMVPDHAAATLIGSPDSIQAAVAKLQAFWDRNISFRIPNAAGAQVTNHLNSVIVEAIGKSAHGSRPEIGDNAVARLCRALAELDLPRDRAWLEWIAISEDPTGVAIGIAGRDDVAGPLTCNLGVFNFENGEVTALYNIRYPVTWKIEDLLGLAQPTAEAGGWTISEHTDSPPLYVPLDQEPAKTLMRVYQLETGDTASRPLTMGGGTYARSTPNVIAYGLDFPEGGNGPAHEPNERLNIEHLIKATKIYAHALYELARL